MRREARHSESQADIVIPIQDNNAGKPPLDMDFFVPIPSTHLKLISTIMLLKELNILL